MTLKEQIAQAKAKKLSLREKIAQAKEKKLGITEPVPEVVPEPEYEGNWYDKPRAALQGMTLGFSDELGAGAGAAMAKIMGADEDYTDIYRQMHDRLQDEREVYREENPAEALAFELGGGLLTGGVGAGRVAGAKALQNAGKIKKGFALAGAGATEGAIAGAGGADKDSILEDSVTGGTVGAILPVALKGLGKGADAFSRRRVMQELDGELFTPLNQALPEGSRLQNYMQKNVAPSNGGSQLREQNKAFLDNAINKQKSAKDALTTAKTLTKSAKEKNFRDIVKSGAIPLNADDEAVARLASKDATEAVDELADIWKGGFKTVKDKSFNLNPDELTDDILEDFTGVVDEKYSQQIRKSLSDKLKKGYTPDVEESAVKYKSKGLFGSELADDVVLDKGKIDGDSLMQARNDLRMDARAIKDEGEGALRKHAMNRTADKIDDFIKANLDGDEATDFAKDLNSWGVYQRLRGATGAAEVGNQGAFSPTQFLQANKSANKRGFEQGKLPLQSEAKAAQLAQKELEKQSQDALSDATQGMISVKKKTPLLKPTPYQKAAATVGVGLAPALATGGASIPLNPLISKALSTKTAQKALAGQTRPQKLMAEALRKSRKTDWTGDDSLLDLSGNSLSGNMISSLLRANAGE